MRLSHCAVLVMLCGAAVVGCGGGDEEEVQATGPTETSTTAATAEATPTEEAQLEELSFAPPFPDKDNPFAPPKETEVFVEPEITEPEPLNEVPLSLPPMRLLGFVNVGGKRALLSYDGEVKLVAKGDRLKLVEVVDVDFPNLKLQHFEKSLALNLFEQEWQNLPSGKRRGVAATSPDNANTTQGEIETNQILLPNLPPPSSRSRNPQGLPGLPRIRSARKCGPKRLAA